MSAKTSPVVSIEALSAFEGQTVTLRGWVQNRRDSKGIVFLVLRDGSGFVQCVVLEEKIGEETFDRVKRLGLESALQLTGNVKKDERQVGGYEIEVDTLEIYSEAEEYPIGKKEHGVEFLMDRRHLWLRSRRQSSIKSPQGNVIHQNTFRFNQGSAFFG